MALFKVEICGVNTAKLPLLTEEEKRELFKEIKKGNMEARAIVRNVRMTPRKIKLICDLIRGKDAGEAMAIIMNPPKAACEPMEKLLKSAVANAENNHGMNTDKLYVKEVHVGPGPIMKRVMPRAQGRAFRILKRTSHITLVLGERE